MAISLVLFQAVINLIAVSVIGGIINRLDAVYLLESPHMSFLDLFCVLFVITEVYEFLQALRVR